MTIPIALTNQAQTRPNAARLARAGFASLACFVAVATVVGCSGTSAKPLASTSVALTSSTSATNLNGAVTFTATLTGGSTSSAPIGTITFFDGTTSLQAVVITGKTTVSTTVTTLPAGANSITAVYAGDQANAASTSAATSVNVSVPTSTAVTASPTVAGVGDSVTLTAIVTGTATYNPTGTVTFASNGTVLGSAALAAGKGGQVATLVTTALPLGADSITATYAASGFYLGSVSSPTIEQIHAALIPTSTALGVTPGGSIASGTLVTLTATLTPTSAGASAASGTFTFLDGTRVLGTAAVTANTASFQTKQFAVGTNSLTAVYSGDAVYNTSTSTASSLSMAAYTGATYTNPLKVSDPTTGTVYNCPDPAIIKTQLAGANTWYAYCTGDTFNSVDNKSHLISILKSTDLVNWTYVRDALAATPAWSSTGQDLQTPAIKLINGIYTLYYETPSAAAAPNGSAIGVATSLTPGGPFTDSGTPLIDQSLLFAGGPSRTKFAPEVIADGTGQLWIVYGGVYGGLNVRTLNATGTALSSSSEVSIGVDNYYQNPYLFFKNGYFYEFVTAGACCSGPYSTYNVHVGRSKSITGPYNDAEGNDLNAYSTPASQGAPGGDPVLVMNGNDIVGAGSNSVFTDESGQDYILYSGVSRKTPYLPNYGGYTARQLMMDALDWVNGWPVARYGAGPSDFSLPQPVPAAQPGATNGYVPPIFTPDGPGTAIAAASDDFNSSTLSTQWTFLHTPASYTLNGSAYVVQSVNQESCRRLQYAQPAHPGRARTRRQLPAGGQALLLRRPQRLHHQQQPGWHLHLQQ